MLSIRLVSLRQSKINNVQFVSFLRCSYQKIIRFNVSVDESFRMNVLDTSDHTIGQHQCRFQTEFLTKLVEQILQGWA